MNLELEMIFMKLIILIGFVCIAFALHEEEKDPIITIPNLGSIQGKVVETAWSKRKVFQFVDVKYAEAPSGKYRFKV